MNQTLGTLLMPMLYTDKTQAITDVGIYGANYKIAIVMVMFIQAFRFAYEPFIFARAKEQGEDRLQSYRDAMRWFLIFAMVIFIGVMYYMDILRHFIASSYFSGLRIVPILMIAELFSAYSSTSRCGTSSPTAPSGACGYRCSDSPSLSDSTYCSCPVTAT